MEEHEACGSVEVDTGHLCQPCHRKYASPRYRAWAHHQGSGANLDDKNGDGEPGAGQNRERAGLGHCAWLPRRRKSCALERSSGQNPAATEQGCHGPASRCPTLHIHSCICPCATAAAWDGSKGTRSADLDRLPQWRSS